MISPAFQLYSGDWLSSPKIALMTPAQEGAYIRLLCYAWSDPDCSIPDDEQALAQLSRLGEGWFSGGSTAIRECFAPHPDKPGRLINLRIMKERKKQEAWREKSRIGGLNSGKSRALVEKGGSTTREADGSMVVEPKANSSSSSPKKKEEEGRTAPPVSDVEGPTVKDIIGQWNQIPGAKPVIVERLTPGRGLHKRITVLTRQQKDRAGNWWHDLFHAVTAQKLFLFSGLNAKQWVADLAWILGPENLAKVLERRYEDFRVPKANSTGHVEPKEHLTRIPL